MQLGPLPFLDLFTASPLPFTLVWLLRTFVDSLDRTNIAMFCIGKVALGHQLAGLGLSTDPALRFTDPADSAAVTVLAQMYEDLGDVVARQYGGSGEGRH